MRRPAGADRLHRASHKSLVPLITPPPAVAGIPPDAIIVPTSRRAWNLRAAIRLAREADCRLIVLCSMRTRPAIVRLLCTMKRFAQATVVEIPRGYTHPFLTFETSEWAKNGPGRIVCGVRDSDLSVKRNIGLLMARMLGWRRVFFMDDDIRDVSAFDLTRTVSLLGDDGSGYRTASIRVKDFPDNSVVCHARRAVGEEQDVFVTGSVLAVDTTEPVSFFPDLYNEDWLFFYQDVARGRMASPAWKHATQVKQVKYNPFDDPLRAATEEFGDMLTEGLFALLHQGLNESDATDEYWSAFLRDRRRLLDEVTGQLRRAPREQRCEIDKAIETARRTLSDVTPELCSSFLAAWGRDLDRWNALWSELPPAASVTDALATLGLRQS